MKIELNQKYYFINTTGKITEVLCESQSKEKTYFLKSIRELGREKPTTSGFRVENSERMFLTLEEAKSYLIKKMEEKILNIKNLK